MNKILCKILGHKYEPCKEWYHRGFKVCKRCKNKVFDKELQKQILIEMMQEDQRDGLYDT